MKLKTFSVASFFCVFFFSLCQLVGQCLFFLTEDFQPFFIQKKRECSEKEGRQRETNIQKSCSIVPQHPAPVHGDTLQVSPAADRCGPIRRLPAHRAAGWRTKGSVGRVAARRPAEVPVGLGGSPGRRVPGRGREFFRVRRHRRLRQKSSRSCFSLFCGFRWRFVASLGVRFSWSFRLTVGLLGCC